MKKMLIAYTSKTGTTKEAAMIIKETFEKSDFEVDVLTFEQVTDLSPYASVIIGAPINGFRWVPEAAHFVEKNEDNLKKIPTAFFAMNYIAELGRAGIKKTIHKSFDSLKGKIKPQSVGFFGGKIDKELPGFARLLFGVKKGSPIDLSQPELIKQWADDLKTKF